MFDLFTTREIVALIYLTPFVVILIINMKARNAAYKVIQVACRYQIIIPFVILLLYAAILILGMTFFPFWKWMYLKDIIIWLLFVGVPMCFNATGQKLENQYFKNMVMDNIKLVALVEFFFNTFTFNFVTEFLLQIFLFFLLLLYEVSTTKNEYHDVKEILDIVLSIVGILLFLKTLHTAIVTYPGYDVTGLIVSLLIPLIFSLLYVPVAYLLALFSRYQLLFIRMRFKKDDNWKTIARYKAITICLCGLSIKKIAEFEEMCTKRVYIKMGKEEFSELVYDYQQRKKVECCA